MTTGVSVRALASPGFALALVVLVLNDHVLKTAYPGWITGKLSDVAGLVVAPLLLGVLLTAWRVPRPMLVAIAVVGLGFTLTKATAAGAATASDLWSLTGVPTLIRADVTDLLALPALYGAWLVHRHAAALPPGSWRATVARAIGVALLPVAVLATAATSCATTERPRPTSTWCSGRFSPGDRAGARSGSWSSRRSTSMAGNGSRRLDRGARVTMDFPDDGHPAPGQAACDDDGTCWRIDPEVDYVPSVQMSTDGGTTWSRTCGSRPTNATRLWRASRSVATRSPRHDLRGPGGPGRRRRRSASPWPRRTRGSTCAPSADGWTRVPLADDRLDLETGPAAQGELSRIEPLTRPRTTRQPPQPGETESLPPEPTCEDPVTVSVTPNPQNGPPTTYVRCS